MSAPSKSSSATTRQDLEARAADADVSVEEYERLAAPLDPALLSRAEAVADGYAILIERHDDGRYYGRGVEYPYLMGDGDTPAEAFAMARDGLVAAIAVDLSDGQSPPAPAGDERDQHIDVTVSAAELQRLQALANRKGFAAISDLLRDTALTSQ